MVLNVSLADPAPSRNRLSNAMRPHLLQIANVGDICGGTAACAWSVKRALPMFRHSVIFLSRLTPATIQAFPHCKLVHTKVVTFGHLQAIQPDLCLLHNTSPGRFPSPISLPTILFRHSAGERAKCDLDVVCSQWLAEQVHGLSRVLYQGVPLPPKPFPCEDRNLRQRLLVGRICTPSARKWPVKLIDFYAVLAKQHPKVDWEFIGCPSNLQTDFQQACRGRARFLPANWQARQHLWRWHALLYHHPSLTESFGRTVAEAMRVGCIPIVDDRGGFREQVSPQSGFLCTTLHDFDAALHRLAEERVRREISAQTSDEVNRKFSLTAFSERLLSLFKQLQAHPDSV